MLDSAPGNSDGLGRKVWIVTGSPGSFAIAIVRHSIRGVLTDEPDSLRLAR